MRLEDLRTGEELTGTYVVDVRTVEQTDFRLHLGGGCWWLARLRVEEAQVLHPVVSEDTGGDQWEVLAGLGGEHLHPGLCFGYPENVPHELTVALALLVRAGRAIVQE